MPTGAGAPEPCAGEGWALRDFPRKLWPGSEGTGGQGLLCQDLQVGGQAPDWGRDRQSPSRSPSIAWLSVTSLQGQESLTWWHLSVTSLRGQESLTWWHRHGVGVPTPLRRALPRLGVLGRHFYSTAPHGALQGGYPSPLRSPFPLGHILPLGWGWDRAGHGPAGPCEPPQQSCCWLGLGGTGQCHEGAPAPATPLCFDTLQDPVEPSGLEPATPPRRVSLGSLSCHRGRAGTVPRA